MKHQEHILAVKSDLFAIENNSIEFKEGEISGSDIFVGQRAGLEKDLYFRQVIPYAVIRCGDKYGVYQRQESGGESRLHLQHSIGVGGHLDADDCVMQDSVIDLDKTLMDGAIRELTEELVIEEDLTQDNFEILSHKIVSSKNETDSVHIGVVIVVTVNSENIKSNEEHIKWLGFFAPEQLKEIENMESWSSFIIDNL